MARLTAAEIYPIVSVIALLVTAALNIPALSLGIALIGLPAGLFLLQRDSLTRAGMLAIVGFAIAAALAVFALVR